MFASQATEGCVSEGGQFRSRRPETGLCFQSLQFVGARRTPASIGPECCSGACALVCLFRRWLPTWLRQAVEWCSSRSATEIISEREAVVLQLEAADRKLRETGVLSCWFGSADVEIAAVSQGVNGALFQQLLKAHGYADWGCVDLLRDCARVVSRGSRL